MHELIGWSTHFQTVRGTHNSPSTIPCTYVSLKSQARSTLDTQRVEADSARLCFPVIPTESSAANVRTFKRHNVVNLVLCRPLLHLPNLLVLVNIDDVRELSARVVTPGGVAITCFAIENACAYTHAHKFSGILPQSCTS
jgi:hypothetical protein